MQNEPDPLLTTLFYCLITKTSVKKVLTLVSSTVILSLGCLANNLDIKSIACGLTSGLQKKYYLNLNSVHNAS